MAEGSLCHMKNQNNVKINVAYTKHFATKSNVKWIPPPQKNLYNSIFTGFFSNIIKVTCNIKNQNPNNISKYENMHHCQTQFKFVNWSKNGK